MSVRLFEKITADRTSSVSKAKSVGESSQAEGNLANSLKTLFAVAANYPELKANQNFTQLQGRVSYLEGSELPIGANFITIP